MLFVPRQVALAAAAMAKEEPKKEKRSKSKAAAKGSPAAAAAAAALDARAAVVASVAAFLETAGFPRALAALQSEANLEAGAWKSSPVSLDDLVAKFLESSNSAPVAVVVGSNDQDKATENAPEDAGKKKKNTGGDTEVNESENTVITPSALQEAGAGEDKKKKKRRKKGGSEACEPDSKASEPSAQEKTSENAGGETKEKKHKKKKDDSSAGNAGGEASITVKSDDQKLDGKKKKSKKLEKDDDVEARLEKVEEAIKNKFEATPKPKEDGSKLKEEELKSQRADVGNNGLSDGALDKAKKKKKGKSGSEKSEKSDAVAAAAEADGTQGKSDAGETVKDDNEKKAKKKRKKSNSEETNEVEGKEVAGKGSVPKPDDANKSGMETEEGENGKPSSDNAGGKKRKLEELEEVEGTKENGTANQTLSNGFTEDNPNENGFLSKPSKKQKLSSEPKTVHAFQRVKLENIKFADERLQDNSYWAKGGADSGYGAKAQDILGQVRGRGFRHEKTKKKRGTYRGGQIDLGTHSIKFDNSDDE